MVSQQIIHEIKNNKISNNNQEAPALRFDGKGFCFMEVGNKKAGYIDADFYNEGGPILSLYPPSEELYQKKIDFERSRLSEWLM